MSAIIMSNLESSEKHVSESSPSLTSLDDELRKICSQTEIEREIASQVYN